MAEPAPPTLRCLREDLRLTIPPVNRPLDEIDHPVVRKAVEAFADLDSPARADPRRRRPDPVQSEGQPLARRGLFIRDLVRASLLDGHEHAVMFDGAAVGVHVLTERGHETCAAIRIIGSVPPQMTATILSLIPGCDPAGWMSDYAMPERPMAPQEQIWSNLMDPSAAAKFLDEEP